jgi:hypothetical protein
MSFWCNFMFAFYVDPFYGQHRWLTRYHYAKQFLWNVVFLRDKRVGFKDSPNPITHSFPTPLCFFLCSILSNPLLCFWVSSSQSAGVPVCLNLKLIPEDSSMSLMTSRMCERNGLLIPVIVNCLNKFCKIHPSHLYVHCWCCCLKSISFSPFIVLISLHIVGTSWLIRRR